MLRKRNKTETQEDRMMELGALLSAGMQVMLDPPAIALHNGVDPMETPLELSFEGEGHRWVMTLRYDGLSDEAALTLGDSRFQR